MPWVAFHKWKQAQLDGQSQPNAPVDFNNDSIALLLLKSTADPATNVGTWEDVADAVASSAEVTGTNYARKDLAGVTVTLSGGTVTVDASDPTAYAQDASGFDDARYAILYKKATADASAPVIAYYDFGSNKGNTTGSLTLQFSSTSGIFTFS